MEPLLEDQQHKGSSRRLYGTDHIRIDHHHHPAHQSAKSSVAFTLANNLKQYIGAGILGLPYAFSQTGLVASAIVLVIVAFLCDHCIKLLLKCKQHIIENMGEPADSYGAITYVCLGRYGELLVNALLVFSCGGACTVYLIFVSTNLNEFFPQVETIYWILITIVPLALIGYVPSIKYLAPLSGLATLAVVTGTFLFMGYSLDEAAQKKEIMQVDVWNIPYFTAICLFAYEGILLVIPLQTSMKEPSKFIFVENVSYVILTILFLSFGIIGYLAYGKYTNEVITLNLPTGSKLPTVITACLCFSLFVSYTLFSRPVFDVFESYIQAPASYSARSARVFTFVKIVLVRLFTVLTTALLAILFPSFGSILGIIGSLSGSMYALILPATFDVYLFHRTMSLAAYVKNIIIIAIGVSVGILGFLTSIGVLDD